MLTILLAALGAVALLCVLTVIVASFRLYRLLRTPGLFGPTFTVAPNPLTTTETVIAGAALGVFAGFVHSFGLGAPWPALLQFAIAVTAVYGVNVITGPAFRNLFNLPQGVLMLISLALGGLQIGVPYVGISPTWAGVVQGAVAFALSLGFGTAVSAAAAQRARPR